MSDSGFCPRCCRLVTNHAEAVVNGRETLICPTEDGGANDRREVYA